MMKVATTLALLAVIAMTVGAVQLTQQKAQPEVRVFLIDKMTKQGLADLTGWTATLEIMAKGAAKKSINMQIVDPMKKGPGVMHERREQERQAQQYPGQEQQRRELAEIEHPVCAQVKELDKWYVELAVILPEHLGEEQKGFLHHHDAPYFMATLDPDVARKGTPINFTSDVIFKMRGETKIARGYSYPVGLYADVTNNLVKEDLKAIRDFANKNQFDQATERTLKCLTSVQALPPLVLEDPKKDFEKVRQECVSICRDMEMHSKASNRDNLLRSVDTCEDKIEELGSLAKEAKGVRF